MLKTINDMVREVVEREGERVRSDGYTQHPCIKCKEDTLVWQNTVSDWICESCGEWEGGD